MTESWYVCTHCGMGYSDTLRGPGERCNDLSWVPHRAFGFKGTLRVYRRLQCRGQVWPMDSGHTRWTAAELLEWQRSQIALATRPRVPA